MAAWCSKDGPASDSSIGKYCGVWVCLRARVVVLELERCPYPSIFLLHKQDEFTVRYGFVYIGCLILALCVKIGGNVKLAHPEKVFRFLSHCVKLRSYSCCLSHILAFLTCSGLTVSTLVAFPWSSQKYTVLNKKAAVQSDGYCLCPIPLWEWRKCSNTCMHRFSLVLQYILKICFYAYITFLTEKQLWEVTT